MNRAVTQDPTDHNPFHPTIPDKWFSQFLNQLNNMDL